MNGLYGERVVVTHYGLGAGRSAALYDPQTNTYFMSPYTLYIADMVAKKSQDIAIDEECTSNICSSTPSS
jgi:hypothetical protein